MKKNWHSSVVVIITLIRRFRDGLFVVLTQYKLTAVFSQEDKRTENNSRLCLMNCL